MEQAFGNGVKVPAEAEAEMVEVARKSVVAAAHIPTRCYSDTGSPCHSPTGYGPQSGAPGFLIGRRTAQAIPAGTLVRMDQLA